jgi:hypothetical protein
MLNEERKAIEAEEASKRSTPAKTVAFLQTALGTAIVVWFLTSVVVTGVTLLISKELADAANRREAKAELDKINVEITARISQFDPNPQLRDFQKPPSAEFSCAYANIVGDVVNVAPSRRAGLLSIYPEFNNLSLFALVTIFHERSIDKDQKDQAESVLQALKELSSQAHSVARTESRSSVDDCRRFVDETKRILGSDSIPVQWRL